MLELSVKAYGFVGASHFEVVGGEPFVCDAIAVLGREPQVCLSLCFLVACLSVYLGDLAQELDAFIAFVGGDACELCSVHLDG